MFAKKKKKTYSTVGIIKLLLQTGQENKKKYDQLYLLNERSFQKYLKSVFFVTTYCDITYCVSHSGAPY